MAETDIHTAPESPEEIPEWAEKEFSALREVLTIQHETLALVLKSLADLADTQRITSDVIGRAAPLLESKAARVALGVERHPVLSALSGKGSRRG